MLFFCPIVFPVSADERLEDLEPGDIYYASVDGLQKAGEEVIADGTCYEKALVGYDEGYTINSCGLPMDTSIAFVENKYGYLKSFNLQGFRRGNETSGSDYATARSQALQFVFPKRAQFGLIPIIVKLAFA